MKSFISFSFLLIALSSCKAFVIRPSQSDHLISMSDNAALSLVEHVPRPHHIVTAHPVIVTDDAAHQWNLDTAAEPEGPSGSAPNVLRERPPYSPDQEHIAQIALDQARAEGLTLLEVKSITGYRGVYMNGSNPLMPYQAQAWRGGKSIHLGRFATGASLHTRAP